MLVGGQNIVKMATLPNKIDNVNTFSIKIQLQYSQKYKKFLKFILKL